MARNQKANTMIKFGGWFYCALIEGIYVFNGIFMSMKMHTSNQETELSLTA
eukprot:UN12070